jgi:hypothetical protein
MNASVVIPWRSDCPHRRAARAWALARWRAAGYEPLLGEPPAGPWCKAAAVADALARADSPVLVVADADVWCDGIDTAVDAVLAGASWAIPHHQVRRLGPQATADVLTGGPLGGGLEQRPYTGFEGGGMVVLPRALYERAPLDRRFAGWGQEDEAWALALRALAGPPWRGQEPLWHLWHPPQARDSRRWGSVPSRALHARYRAARTPEAMTRLLGEMEVA